MEALKEKQQPQFFDKEVQEVQEELKRKDKVSDLLEPAAKRMKILAGAAFGEASVATCFEKPLDFAQEGS